ncbi:hypothetical protein [Paenibacillus pabuli]
MKSINEVSAVVEDTASATEEVSAMTEEHQSNEMPDTLNTSPLQPSASF